MYNNLTNLLPIDRKRALSRDYFLRLGVIVTLFAIALTLASAALLLPTYIFLTENIRAKKEHIANIESALSSVNGAELSARLATLSRNTTALSALALMPSVSAITRSALTVSRPGITLSGFSYTPAKGTDPGVLLVSGTALTRNALRNYQLALQSAQFTHSADLPVSAYAKDSNIDFTITVTLAP